MQRFGTASWPWALGADGKFHAYSSGLGGAFHRYWEEMSVAMVIDGKDPGKRALARFGTACGFDADFSPTGALYPRFMVLTRYVAKVPRNELRCLKCAEKTRA